MKKLIFFSLMMFTQITLANDEFNECSKIADQNLIISIPFFPIFSGDFNERIINEEKLLIINRKATPQERSAIKEYLLQSELCLKKLNLPPEFQATSPTADTQDIIELLRDGKVTFAEYAVERIKTLKSIEIQVSKLELQKKQKQSKNNELDNIITLSCLLENPLNWVGLEFQFQINETKKTIWANRGSETPTGINIGALEIKFSQGNDRISISRNTGRFAILNRSTLITGICQTITQRKF